MSEKIKLVNGVVFELLPIGVSENPVDKTRTFKFSSPLVYSEVEDALTSLCNLQTTQRLSETDEVISTYNDIASLKYLTKESGTNNYIAILSIDEVLRRLSDIDIKLTAALQALQNNYMGGIYGEWEHV